MAATEYLVFVQGDAATEWSEAGTYTAASSGAAKAAAALEHGDGTYVATPARSWQPAAFKVQPRAVKT